MGIIKYYPYKNKEYTSEELWRHKDCTIPLWQLRLNLWRHMPVDKAITTPIKHNGRKTKQYPYKDGFYTAYQIMDFPNCEITQYYALTTRLKAGLPVEFAIRKDVRVEDYKNSVKKLNRTKVDHQQFYDVAKAFPAQPGQISFKEPEPRSYMVYEEEVLFNWSLWDGDRLYKMSNN